MHIPPRFDRVVALVLCTMLSACAPGANFGSSTAISKPNPAVGAFLAARYAETMGDSENATRFYLQALRADPENQALLQDSFLAGLWTGDPAVVSLAPRLKGNAMATLALGNAAAMDGDYGKAAGYFETLPHDELTAFMQPLLLAWTAFGQGHEEQALTVLQSAGNQGSFDAIYRLNAALIADAAGDTKRAAQLYGSIGGGPLNLRAAQILASWYARQGDKVRANAILTGFANAHPDLVMALPSLRAQMAQPAVATAQQGLAEAYLTVAASFPQTQATFLRTVLLRFALTLRPDLSSARMVLANSLIDADGARHLLMVPRAEAALDVLAGIQPEDPLYVTAVIQESRLNAAIDRNDEAARLLAQLIAQHPDNPLLLALAGNQRRLANQCSLALPYYQRAIALLGSAPPPNAWPLFFDRGICEDQQGDWHVAEMDIQLALRLSPNQPYVLNYLAYRWAQQGVNLEEAQQMLVRALSLAPQDGGLLDSLGFVELKRGNTKQALTLLIEAVRLAPANAEVNAHLGDAFHQDGRVLQAIYQWNRALTLNPDAALKATLTAQTAQAMQALKP